MKTRLYSALAVKGLKSLNNAVLIELLCTTKILRGFKNAVLPVVLGSIKTLKCPKNAVLPVLLCTMLLKTYMEKIRNLGFSSHDHCQNVKIDGLIYRLID